SPYNNYIRIIKASAPQRERPRRNHPDNAYGPADAGAGTEAWLPNAMDLDVPPVLNSVISNRLIVERPVGRPHFNVPAAITETFCEIGKNTCADDLIGVEEVIK